MGNKNKRPQTGGLQEKKIKIEPTKEEIKQDRKAEKLKMREKRREAKKDRVKMSTRFKEMFGELKKVNWPNFSTTIKQTGVVLGVVVIFSLVVFGIDRGLGELFKLLTKGLAQ